ncbi:MAG: hypothetical protein U0103_04015 [Candidatus Obscuribacterales bacterium]
MARLDRREKVALDQAYEFYKSTIGSNEAFTLHSLVNSLKTVSVAVSASNDGHLTLTTRLWMRIKQALFDKLLTTHPAYVIIYDGSNAPIEPKQRIPDDGTIEIHPHGLRRDDDRFSIELKHLHPVTRKHIQKVWIERGPDTKSDDFSNYECDGDVCMPKLFLIGDEVLQKEASNGKKEAYSQWWDLYWQSYCTPDRREKQQLTRRMNSLEAVWGNLYY